MINPVALAAEALFGVVLAMTAIEYARRPDPLRRALVLVALPLTSLFLVDLARLAVNPLPRWVTILAVGILLAQPMLTLNLVAQIRRVPGVVRATAFVAFVGTAIPVAMLDRPGAPMMLVVATVAFVGVELLAAGYLAAEARQRRGPARRRLMVASQATGVLAVAILFAAAASAGPTASSVLGVLPPVLALVAGFGYVVAFVPPAFVRRLWQAETMVSYGRDLVGQSGAAVQDIWAGYADLARDLGGDVSAVVIAGVGETASIVAASGPPVGIPTGGLIAREALRQLVTRSMAMEQEPRMLGSIVERLAGPTNARFASVVPLEMPDGEGGAGLVILSRQRSLFHASDLELLAALGAPTAILAGRRSTLAEQEALASHLASTVDALRRADEAKSDFVASMSHELRTPLSAILGFSDLMRQQEHRGADVLVPLEWVEHVHRGGEHLLGLINDVLDLAKVEAGRLDLRTEPLDLAGSVAEALSGLRPLAERKHQRLYSEVSSQTVEADRGRLRQILYNLVSNAIKYTPDGGEIRVDARPLGAKVALTVSDTGVGIAAEDQVSAFEEFSQVGELSTREGGTGLGLALTRRLVEAHGGRIELESTVGVGSRFTVFLPAAASSTIGPVQDTEPVRIAATAGAEPLGPLTATPGLDVLVIEDDPSALRLLREYLAPTRCRVRVAVDGNAGLAAARAAVPGAIILDVLLPGIDGWEVLRRLKADDRLRDVPVVMLTVIDEREIGLALGAVDYLVKPVDRETLLACLARHALPTLASTRATRVLAVDDDPTALAMFRGLLEPEGFEVVVARDGREALELASRERLDFVICDLVMPNLDGFEVIAALKADPATASLPILVCTAQDLSATDKERLNDNLVGLMSKSSDMRAGLSHWLRQVTAAGAESPV
ncbi:MAG TPA: response regulator [Methylomirabilota bacterium]|nr:response regulator [Methylomirabilota bacterium]